MTPAERSLLLAVFRWARAKGVRLDGAMRWTSPPPHRWGVDFCPYEFDRDEPVHLAIWRTGFSAKDYWVTSIAEAVDVLVALGLLPHRFSTSYAAGFEAVRWVDALRATPQSLAVVPGTAVADAIAGMEPAAPRELAVRT